MAVYGDVALATDHTVFRAADASERSGHGRSECSAHVCEAERQVGACRAALVPVAK